MTDTHHIPIRVRYSETDAMGFLHHSQFFSYFEMGRVELFRAAGGDYRALEERGYFLVIVHLECDFKKPARFDDLLTLTTHVARMTPAKLEHTYELHRGDDLLAKARSILACVDRTGQVQRLSEELLYGAKS